MLITPCGCDTPGTFKDRGFLLNSEMTSFDALPFEDVNGVSLLRANRPEGGKVQRLSALGK